MESNINAYCSICGTGYHICKSCSEQKTFKPWRTVVDSVEHYKIYLALHGYTLSKNKEIAKQELHKCDLSDLDKFKPEIKAVIEDILAEPEKNEEIVMESEMISEEKIASKKRNKRATMPIIDEIGSVETLVNDEMQDGE